MPAQDGGLPTVQAGLMLAEIKLTTDFWQHGCHRSADHGQHARYYREKPQGGEDRRQHSLLLAFRDNCCATSTSKLPATMKATDETVAIFIRLHAD